MPKRLSKKQKGFVKDFIESGNGTQAALKNYDTKDYMTAAVIATENLKKPNIRELIEGYAERATKNIQNLADNAENETVKLNANKDQLDRAGYKPIEKSMTVNIEIESTPEIKALTEELNALYGSTN